MNARDHKKLAKLEARIASLEKRGELLEKLLKAFAEAAHENPDVLKDGEEE